ncbi:MAG: nicotinate-nucleotide adenylyltransferase, partial [Bacteroidota bacterium]|nr:nicotinate-nucleotide adenylyltransferase [Bacteroidota bacterium]MDX5430400.1 nicotinate-nucleotide adenylyltransferase [Bacteroidota bacterium]MDX5469159.1 nicotinate-nucleotide adenylyltransferase [Bacteroidota bacterium]
MKTGLFFGSFNPIHVGHLIIANYMLEFTEVEEVWFVVSPQNPFKIHDRLADEQHRLAMVRLAVEDNPSLKAVDVEFNLSKPSFTIHTLHHLKEQFPEREFILIMGSDNLAGLPKWKGFEEIITNYNLFVYHREGNDNQTLKARDNVRVFDAPVLNISATFI